MKKENLKNYYPEKFIQFEALIDRIGAFGFGTKHSLNLRLAVTEWIWCRETFQNRYPKVDYMAYLHRKGKGKNVAALVQRIEEKLKLNDRCRFHPTQRPNVLWIEMNPWWNHPVRLSFFTVLLRTSHNYAYTKDNWEKALFSHKYLNDNPFATYRFLDGFTRVSECGWRPGWLSRFHKLDKEEVEKLLIRD